MGFFKDRTLILLIIILGVSIVIFGFFITTNDRGTHLYDINKIHWYEYKMVTSGSMATNPDGSPYKQYWDMKTVYDTVAYGGITNARHMSQINVISTQTSNWTTITDLYFDPSNDYRVLGGHWYNSATTLEQDVMANDSYYRNEDPAIRFLEPIDTNFTYSGTENVTVPAGTFDSTKYTTTEGDWTVIYWHANNVPVPVKKVSTMHIYYQDIYELVDYG